MPKKTPPILLFDVRSLSRRDQVGGLAWNHCAPCLDIFAVGDNGYALRYDGLMWREIDTGMGSDLHAVAGRDGSYYVVGSNGTVLRNNNGMWDLEDSGSTHTLQAVVATGRRVWAVGSGGLELCRQT